jgi:hypothetical protein
VRCANERRCPDRVRPPARRQGSLQEGNELRCFDARTIPLPPKRSRAAATPVNWGQQQHGPPLSLARLAAGHRDQRQFPHLLSPRLCGPPGQSLQLRGKVALSGGVCLSHVSAVASISPLTGPRQARSALAPGRRQPLANRGSRGDPLAATHALRHPADGLV